MSLNEKFNVNENLNVLFEKLEKFFTTKTVIGEPIKVGETTLIPVISLSFGLGSGGGDGDDGKGNKGVGGGAGVGAKVTPATIIVIKPDNSVELLPMKRIGGLDKLLEMVPEIVQKINDSKADAN